MDRSSYGLRPSCLVLRAKALDQAVAVGVRQRVAAHRQIQSANLGDAEDPQAEVRSHPESIPRRSGQARDVGRDRWIVAFAALERAGVDRAIVPKMMWRSAAVEFVVVRKLIHLRVFDLCRERPEQRPEHL